ncbi:MAG TPA: hypothetical protein VMZ91_14950 [Candidatus Paceibacterota bacterium]|nr:hypothetical protein [Candidatus Paceibacterota bacterium]
MVVKRGKQKQRTGKEIAEIYKKMKDEKISPEDVMFYLLIYMEEIKAKEVGMDLKGPSGNNCSIRVKLSDDSIDDEPSNTPTKINDGIVPWVV